MSRFRKVAAGTWGDQRFRSLSEPAQRLWLYLLTGNEVTSLPGLLVVGRAGLAEALSWSLSKLDRCFKELTDAKNDEGIPMAMADWKARVVWLPKGYKHNPPANPNVIFGWKDLWRAVPECDLKHEALLVLRAFVQTLGEKMIEAFNASVDRVDSARRLPTSQPPVITNDESSTVTGTVPSSLSEPLPEPPTRARAPARTAPAPAPALSDPGSPSQVGSPAVERPRLSRFEEPFWKGAYTETVVETLGGPWGFPDKQLSGLRKAIETHCGTLADADGWIRENVAAFVRATRAKAAIWSGFGPDGFLRWLNAERPNESRPSPAAGTAAPKTKVPPYLRPIEQNLADSDAERRRGPPPRQAVGPPRPPQEGLPASGSGSRVAAEGDGCGPAGARGATGA